MRDQTLEILYEDNHIIAVNKHASDLSQGDKTNDESIDSRIKEYLRVKHNKPGEAFLGVVHRLDRPVSGVVLYGKTTKALSRLGEMFRNKEVKKTYWAIVKELPPAEEGELRHFLKKNEVQNKSYPYPKLVKGSKEALLNYKLVARSDNHYLLEIDLHTGRHHQIRCQLAAIGCPIRGDLKYGFNRSNENGSIDLHARKIEFLHPVSKEPISILAPVPKGSFTLMFGNISKEGIKVKEFRQPRREGKNVKEPRQTGKEVINMEESRQPRRDGIKEIESRQPRIEGIKVKESRQPRRDGIKVRESRQTGREGIKVKESRPPRKDGIKVKESRQTGREGIKVKESRQPRRDGVKAKESRPPRREGIKVKESRQTGREGAKVKESRQPRREGIKVKESRQPRRDGVKAKESRPPRKEGIKVKEPRQTGRAPRKK